MRILFITLLCTLMAHADSQVDTNATDMNATESFKNPSLKEGKMDFLTVKGSKLEGQVVGLTSKSLRFELVYGRGSILISFADIDELYTQHSYHIFYDGKESTGKIIGIKDHEWLIVQNGSSMELIGINTIDRFILSTEEDSSIDNYLHNMFPYLSGDIDVNLKHENTNPEINELDLAMHIEYARRLHRVVLEGIYEYDTKTPSDGDEQINKDEYVFNLLYNKYASSELNGFSFALAGAEHDGIRYIEKRYYAAAGPGYRFNLNKDQWISVQGGLGGVYDDFGEFGREHYPAFHLGTEFLYTWDNGVFFRGNIRYMQSVAHTRDTWLFRSLISLTVPLTNIFALKVSVRDLNDNNPSDDIGNNKITTNIGVSLLF